MRKGIDTPHDMTENPLGVFVGMKYAFLPALLLWALIISGIRWLLR